MISKENGDRLAKELASKANKIVFPPQNFVDLCWSDKPQRSKEPIFIQSLEFTGCEAAKKIAMVRDWIKSRPHAIPPTYPPREPSTRDKHVGTLITSLSNIGGLLIHE